MSALFTPSVEIVAHVWNYDRLATLFLSQLVLHPPKTPTLVTICWSEEDRRTGEVISFFAGQLPESSVVQLRPYAMPTPSLLRRAIGRNDRARATTADWVLFADIDYLMGPGAIDAIVAEMTAADYRQGTCLCFPAVAGWSSQADGDALIESVTQPAVTPVPPSVFSSKAMPRAIGGTQWLPGDAARLLGYLPAGHRFLRQAKIWRRTFEDRSARNYWAKNGVPAVKIDVPNVWRIRHSKRGRFDVGIRL